MSITKYTNFDQIDSRLSNEGSFLQPKDLFIVSKKESEISEFGDCKYDVMEVSVYDINNNLLPQKNGKNVSYIKSGDIKNFIYNVTNKGGQKELAIDAEKLLKTLGFSNGILKLNINFVRNIVGNENELNKVWIQEISATRNEIRVLPLKTSNSSINEITKKEFESLIKLNKDFKIYKKNILDSLDSFGEKYLAEISDVMINKFGNEFFTIIKKDFGISSFDDFKKRIFENFKISVDNYLNNRYYDIEQSNFGRILPSPTFIDCEKYDFSMLSMEIEKILYKCVSIQIKSLKRRSVEYQTLPQEFSVVELKKSTQDNLSSFEIPITNRKDIYKPTLVEIQRAGGITETTPIKSPIDRPIETIIKTELDVLPGPPYRSDEIVPLDPPIELPIDFSPPNPDNRDPEPIPLPIEPIIIGGSNNRGGGVSNMSGGDVFTFGQDRSNLGREIDNSNLRNSNEQ